MSTQTISGSSTGQNTSSGSASNHDLSVNSGDSVAQGPENIVNEQEQNISVNQQEFINDDVTSQFVDIKDNPPSRDDDDDDDDDDDEPLVPEIGDDPDETEKKIPVMQ